MRLREEERAGQEVAPWRPSLLAYLEDIIREIRR
jgi:hypothetical protein